MKGCIIRFIDKHYNRISAFFFYGAIAAVAIHIFFQIAIYAFDILLPNILIHYFHLDHEYNIPSVFSASLLFYCSVLLYKIYDGHPPRHRHYFWLVLSAAFLYLSTDELISLHERAILPLRNYFEFSGYLYYSWVVVAFPLTVIFFLWSIPFLKKLPGTYVHHFVFAGLIYVSGAVGFEMIGADIASSKPAPTSENYPWVEIILTIEEGLEITGIVYFNQLLTDFLKKLKPL